MMLPQISVWLEKANPNFMAQSFFVKLNDNINLKFLKPKLVDSVVFPQDCAPDHQSMSIRRREPRP